MKQTDVVAYYEALRRCDIAAVVDALPDLSCRIQSRDGSTIKLDCPRHASTSKVSFHVYLHESRWRCWGCGVGGDSIQLVEFVKNGAVTKGQRGAMPTSHREARDFVAGLLGMAPLSKHGLSQDELSAAESKEREANAAFAALTDLAEFFHDELMKRTEVVEWVRRQWGFSESTIKAYRIGFAPDGGQWKALIELGHTEREAAATGAFTFSNRDDTPIPHFRERVVFPYFSGGRCVYMIARRTPWSSSNQFEVAKYKKLQTYSERRQYVSPAISNRVLFGEDVLATRPGRIIITEGITDAIAAQVAGFPTISPVTVRIAAADIKRIVSGVKRAGVATVYLVEDNELSGIGEKAAVETAQALEAEGIRCLIATIPTTKQQDKARSQWRTLIGDEGAERVRRAAPNEKRKLIESILEGDPRKVELATELAEQAKIDLCIHFQNDHDPESFERILKGAREPIEVAIDAMIVPDGASDAEKVRSAQDVIDVIGTSRPVIRATALDRLAKRLGISVAVIRSEASAASKKSKTDATKAAAAAVLADKNAVIEGAEPGTCVAMVELERASAVAAGVFPDWGRIAEKVFDWFVQQGSRFYRTESGAPLLLHRDVIYEMRSDATGPRSVWEGFVWHTCRVSPSSSGERRFFSVLAGKASHEGDFYKPAGWIKTDVIKREVRVAFGGGDGKHVLKVCAEGIELLPNGADGVFLKRSDKFEDFTYTDNTIGGPGDPGLDEILNRLVVENLACDPDIARVVLRWLLCFPLIEFSGTRPAVRFEGDPASGKSFASKVLTTLLFGRETQKRSTTAANWVDSMANPLVAIDNVESRDETPDAISFYLTATTGVTREKRAGGTSDIAVEKPNCLLLTTGVEPLGGDLTEMTSRTLTVQFEASRQREGMLEREVLAEVREHRSLILSAVLRRTARILAALSEDAQVEGVRAIRKQMRPGDARRCDEYLALMLIDESIGRAVEEDPDAGAGRVLELVADPTPTFVAAVDSIDSASRDTARDSSPIVYGLVGLFGLLEHDRTFREETDLDVLIPILPKGVGGKRVISRASSDRLLTALGDAAKRRGHRIPWKSTTQFGRRFGISLPLLESRGFEIERETSRTGSSLWTIRYDPNADAMFAADAAEGDGIGPRLFDRNDEVQF